MADDLGARLVQAGLVTPDQLAEVRGAAPPHDGALLAALVDRGLNEDAAAGYFVAMGFGPLMDASDLGAAQPEALERLSAALASELMVLPVRASPAGLVVAMAAPTDRHALAELRRVVGGGVLPAVARVNALRAALARAYPDGVPARREAGESEPPLLELVAATRKRELAAVEGYLGSTRGAERVEARALVGPRLTAEEDEAFVPLVRHKPLAPAKPKVITKSFEKPSGEDMASARAAKTAAKTRDSAGDAAAKGTTAPATARWSAAAMPASKTDAGRGGAATSAPKASADTSADTSAASPAAASDAARGATTAVGGASDVGARGATPAGPRSTAESATPRSAVASPPARRAGSPTAGAEASSPIAPKTAGATSATAGSKPAAATSADAAAKTAGTTAASKTGGSSDWAARTVAAAKSATPASAVLQVALESAGAKARSAAASTPGAESAAPKTTAGARKAAPVQPPAPSSPSASAAKWSATKSASAKAPADTAAKGAPASPRSIIPPEHARWETDGLDEVPANKVDPIKLRSVSTPPKRPARPSPIGGTLAAIRASRERDEVVEVACRGALTVCRASVLLALRKGVLKGWDGAGAGLSRDAVRNLWIPTNSPSMFRDVVARGEPYAGPHGTSAADGLFRAAVGSRGGSVALLPVAVGGKVVAVLAADDVSFEREGVDRIESLARAVGEAFERIIVESKQR